MRISLTTANQVDGALIQGPDVFCLVARITFRPPLLPDPHRQLYGGTKRAFS
jgi:hypothetical protein